MNKIIAKINTVHISSNKTKVTTFEILENIHVGKKLQVMEAIQKKFIVIHLRRVPIGPDLRFRLNSSQGGFDTIKDCEEAIEKRSMISFNENGWYKSIETSKDKNGNTIINWVKRIKTTYDENNQIINGIKQSFYGNGILSRLSTYKDGQFHGINKSWHVNGFLSHEVIYVKGKREGKHIVYSEYGNIENINSFKNDKLDGVCESWGYPTESEEYSIRKLSTYKDNKLNGLCKTWNRKGVLEEESYYYDGKLNGSKKYYDIEGNISKHEWYENGVKIDS